MLFCEFIHIQESMSSDARTLISLISKWKTMGMDHLFTGETAIECLGWEPDRAKKAMAELMDLGLAAQY